MKKYLDPSEIDIGNYLNDIADTIETLRHEQESEMITGEDDFYEGYKFPLSKFSEYEFPQRESDLSEICRNLGDYLDWINQSTATPVWIEDDYLVVLC